MCLVIARRSRGEADKSCFQFGLRSNHFADIALLHSVIASEWNERGDPDI